MLPRPARRPLPGRRADPRARHQAGGSPTPLAAEVLSGLTQSDRSLRRRVHLLGLLGLDHLLNESGPDLHLAAIATPLSVKGAIQVNPVIGVSTEKIALALNQRGGQSLGADAVVVGQRRREGGGRNAVPRGTCHNSSPCR